MRWVYKQGKLKVAEYRPIMDALTPSDVIWRPFEDHRGVMPFDPITMYSGYLRGCTVVPHLPERCIRQYGFLQYIPPPPPPAPATDVIDSDWIGYELSIDRVLQATRPVTYAAESTDDYLQWYYTVSHPRLCRPVDGPHGVQPVPQYVPAQQDDPMSEDAPADRRSERYVPRGEHYWRQMAASALQRYIDQIDAQREEETFTDLFMALDICDGVDVDPDHYVP